MTCEEKRQDEKEFQKVLDENLTPEAMLDLHLKRGRNIFLTGQAGTGKSYQVDRILERYPDTDITASTGVAALNVGGMTLHRWAGINIGPNPGETWSDAYARLSVTKYGTPKKGIGRIQNCQRLVIDEVSMLPGDLLNFFNYFCQRARMSDEPFGGIPVIATGDLLQLPPVRKVNYQPYDWCFQSDAWKNAGFRIVLLEKIHRQSDPVFTGALSRLRMGELNKADIALFRDREVQFPHKKHIRLFTHNAKVDTHNRQMVDRIEGDEVTYHAETNGFDSEIEFLLKNILAPRELTLKIGARVMLLVNEPDQSKYFVNGSIGTVLELGKRSATVEIEYKGDAVAEVVVEPREWKMDKKTKGQTSSVSQLPLRPAYALSIHKSQGLTLNSAYIDVRAANEDGQAYVAFSRVKSLEGLLLRQLPASIKFSMDAVSFYKTAQGVNR